MSVDIGMYKFFEYFIKNPYLILVILLLYVFIYALSIFFTGPKPGRNPFSASHVKPVGDLLTDVRARDKILKQRFKVSKIPENIDDIVIGSGIGGLSTASLLSRSGHTVLVLEQHDQAGGCCHTFHEKGYEFDTGIHYIGKMGNHENSRILFDQITGGKVEYPRMTNAFDIVCLGEPGKTRNYNIMDSPQSFKEELVKNFPKEEENIEKFMVCLEECKGFLIALYALKFIPKWLATFLSVTGIIGLKYKSYTKKYLSSTQQVLDSITDNEELKAVITYSFGDYGTPPSKSPFSFHAALTHHYMGGAYYVRGGPSEVVLQTIPVIESTGGRVLVNARVNNIILNKGKAVGVEVKTGDGTVPIYAKHIISDAGVANTFARLLPQEVARKSCIYPTLTKVGNSPSYISVFVGLDGSQEELDITGHNLWCYTRTDLEKAMNEWMDLSIEDAAVAEIPLMFVSFPSAKDPTWAERFPNKNTCLIITLAKYEWFTNWENERLKHRSDEYQGLKNSMGRQMWNQLTQICPKLEGRDDYFEVGTPLSNRYYLGFDQGEMYGMDHVINKFIAPAVVNLRPETDIPGLYITGQDAMACGLSGAMFGGLLCTSYVLHRDLLIDLKALCKELKKKS